MIGNAEIEPQQTKHTAGECLGLAQGKVKHQAQHQYHLDCQIRVDRLSARCGPPWRLPPAESGFVDPERQIAAPFQPSLIGWPVADTVARSRNTVTASGIELERHDPTVPR